MQIRNINLTNFRNFKKFSLDLSSETTVIIGPNASGKTNILEAVFLLSAGKSFRDVRDMETIKFGEEMGRISAEILNLPHILRDPADPDHIGAEVVKVQNDRITNNQINILEMMITKGEVMGIKTPNKKCTVNGVSKRITDFSGTLKTVLFWPQDMDLVSGSPSLRRRYLDFVLIQTDREYRRSLASYEKGIRQRNRILEKIRDEGVNRSQLLFWDQLVIKTGEYITNKREQYISFINNFEIRSTKSETITKLHFPNYQISYDSSVISAVRLDQYKDEEVAAAVTLVGPHRDDIIFRIKNHESLASLREAGRAGIMENEFRNLAHFGSRGEQRLAVLWLKLCELSYVEKESGERPVLLLDDIFSELDHGHRDIVFDLLGKQQTVMSTADEHFIKDEILKSAKIFRL